MSQYHGSAAGPEKAKAIGAVLAVHAALAAVIVSGLDVRTVTRGIERLSTFDISLPPPPPPPTPPPPARTRERAKLEEGAAGKKAEPTPVVVPEPQIAVPAKPPIVAARTPGTGSAATTGAAAVGTGPGAGGSGTGRGGGGTGSGYTDFSKFTPARLISKIPHREYRRISAGRIPRGSATIGFKVNEDGRISNCRIVRSSGDAQVDAVLCDAATRHMRFSPARDPSGRPVAQDSAYTPTWRPNW